MRHVESEMSDFPPSPALPSGQALMSGNEGLSHAGSWLGLWLSILIPSVASKNSIFVLKKVKFKKNIFMSANYVGILIYEKLCLNIL